jgi:hypothetical protein
LFEFFFQPCSPRASKHFVFDSEDSMCHTLQDSAMPKASEYPPILGPTDSVVLLGRHSVPAKRLYSEPVNPLQRVQLEPLESFIDMQVTPRVALSGRHSPTPCLSSSIRHRCHMS